MRRDPSETGGLFLERRPDSNEHALATAPAKKREKKPFQRTLLLALMTFVGMSFWGPIPIGWLWIGAQVQYATEHTTLALLTVFIGVFATLIGGLIILRWLDRIWIIKHADDDQTTGIATRIFAASAVLGGSIFAVWFIFLGGLGPMLAPH